MRCRRCSGRAVRSLLALWAAAAASCDAIHGIAPGAASHMGGEAELSGRLVLESGAGTRTVLEAEPNGWPEDSQFLGEPAMGQTYRVVGSLEISDPDDVVDAYRFFAPAPTTVTYSLRTSERGPRAEFDLDTGVIDFVRFGCSLNGVDLAVFTECHNEALSGESFLFVADGSFEIVVVPRLGRGSYVLDVAFEPADGESFVTERAAAMSRTASKRCQDCFCAGEKSSRTPFSYVPGQTLAVFEAGMSEDEIGERVATRGMRIVEHSPSGVYRLAWAHSKDADAVAIQMRARQAAEDLLAMSGVRLAEPNGVFRACRVPNDPIFAEQRYPELIRLPDAWDLTTGDPDVVIAMIDTGVLYQHPDAGGRLLGGYDFIQNLDDALDGDGRDDDPSDPGDSPDAPHGSTFHGTHVAGILAAMADNGIGLAGVTWNCRVMPIRALGRGASGSAFDVAEAIRYAAGLPNVSGTVPPRRADVLNLSFDSGPGVDASAVVHEALRDAADAGVILVAAAGNNGVDEPSYPGSFPEVISVGAVDWDLERASYSNYGPTIDLVAPGGTSQPDLNGRPGPVLSAAGSDLSGSLTFEYGYRFGTSMACPQVSGVAALMRSVNRELSPDQVRQILSDTARDLGAAGRDDEFGHGLVDALAAVQRARETTGHGSAPPRAALSTTFLDFGTDRTILTVDVFDALGGMIDIDGVTTREWIGQGWLSADPSGSDVSSAVRSVAVTVDRSALAPGVYRGAVEINVDGAAMRIVDVYADAISSTGESNATYVVAIDPVTGDTIASTQATGISDIEFTLRVPSRVPLLVFAGTDRDDDGQICEDHDACGAWPSLLAPLEVTASALGGSGTPTISVFEPPPNGRWPLESRVHVTPSWEESLAGQTPSRSRS